MAPSISMVSTTPGPRAYETQNQEQSRLSFAPVGLTANDDIQADRTNPKKRKQCHITSHIIKTNSKQQLELDILAAKFWYASGLAFNAANTSYWGSFVSKLRPGYVPPTAYRLRESLLNSVYEELKTKMENQISGNDVVIVQDGWSNIHNEPILSHCIICLGKPYFLETIECREHKKSADYVYKILMDNIKRLESLKCRVVGFVTDNCSTMKSLRSIMKSQNEDIFSYGCYSHLLNNLCQDIIPAGPTAKIKEVKVLKI